MKTDFQNHGVVYNGLTSLPIIGIPSRFLLDYTRLGINQYGYILGLLRGGFVGMVMFLIMLFLSEAIPLGWSIVKYYFDIHYLQPVMSGQRSDAVDINSHRKVYRFGEPDLYWLDPGQYLLKPGEPDAPRSH